MPGFYWTPLFGWGGPSETLGWPPIPSALHSSSAPRPSGTLRSRARASAASRGAPRAILSGVVDSDAELLQRWKAGDVRGGEMLFARYYEAVARFFGNKVTQGRADLVQATFSTCLEKVDALQSAASFRSFLFGIARFELLHHYRRRSRHETSFDPEDVSVFDVDPSPSRVIAKHEEQRLLLEALRHIPLDLQIVLELTYWEKLTSAEMADLLSIPEGTVKSRVRRARQRLDAQLTRLAESPRLLDSTTSDLDAWAAQLRAQLGHSSP